jgi:cytochrome P450
VSDLPPDLAPEAELAIVAGSETVSSTLTAVVYLIACNPEKLKLLQTEIDERLPSVDNVSHSRLIGAPVLEGCINEALRLYPPVPVGLQRLTPPGGATIAGKWIPGDTLVSVPTYSIHRGNNSPPNTRRTPRKGAQIRPS